MRMNMSDFATFFAVARNQSFRAAGDELGLLNRPGNPGD